MAICARCNRTRDKSVPIIMRCNCDIKDSMKRRRLAAEGLESTIMIGGVEKVLPRGGFRIKNGKIKSNITRNRAARDRKRALLIMKIKELHSASNKLRSSLNYGMTLKETSAGYKELEELDALILNLQQELNEL